MSQCPQCGAATQPGQFFCGVCGTSLASPAEVSDQTVVRPVVPRGTPASDDQPTAQFPVAPPHQPWEQPSYAAPAAPASGHASIDWSRLRQARVLQGDWGGAAKVAGAMFGVAAGLSFVLGLLGSLDDFDFGAYVATSLLGIGNTFGIDTVRAIDDATTTTGQFPTLITVVTLGLGGLLFRRLTATRASIRSALADAARVAAVLMGLLFGLAILLRIVNPDITPSGELGATSFSSAADHTHLDFVGTIFQGFLLPFAVLALVAFFRRDLLTGKAAVVHDWLLPVVHGAAALLVGLFAAGVVFSFAMLVGNDDARDLDAVVVLLSGLPGVGLWLIGLGVGAEHGARFNGDFPDKDFVQRLSGFADDNGALFWVAPLAALALSAFAVYVVIARTRDRALVARNVAVFVGGLLVLMPFLVRLSNTHTHASAGDEDYYTFAGIDGFQTTMLFFLLTAAVAVVLLLLTGNLDLTHVQAKASSLAQTVKETSGQQPGSAPPGPPPGWQPPGPPSGPPPGPPGPPPGWEQPQQ